MEEAVEECVALANLRVYFFTIDTLLKGGQRRMTEENNSK